MIDPPPHFYVHGPGIDEPLAVEHGNGAIWYYHTDGLASIVRATDAAGNVVHSRQYDAFGRPEDGADQEGYAYTGREWDPESGLYYYRARYYDPKIGRFISEDPIGLRGGINFYAYVQSNPVNYTDPMGLQGCNNNCGPGNNTQTEACIQRCLNAGTPSWLKFTLIGAATPIIAADFPAVVTAGAGIAVGGAGYYVGTGLYCTYQCKRDQCFQYP